MSTNFIRHKMSCSLLLQN